MWPISTRPVKTAPSSIASRGEWMLPSTRAVLCRTTWPLALMSPWTSPEMITTCDLMVAVTEPLSPTINVFSLEISPSKRPSIRTVSLNDNLPENSEPWSMNAVSAPTPPALAVGAFIAGSSLPPLRKSLKPIGAHSRSDRSNVTGHIGARRRSLRTRSGRAISCRSLMAADGVDEIKAELARARASGKVHGGYLFEGPPGTGKRATAEWFARLLLCKGAPPDAREPCGRCHDCALLAAGSHPDLHRVEVDGAWIKVDGLRELLRALS